MRRTPSTSRARGRTLVVALLAVLGTVATLAVATPASAVVYPGNQGRYVVNQAQGLCLTYPRAAFDAHGGGPLILDYCRGQVNQKWIYRSDRLLQSENGDCAELDNISGVYGYVNASLCNPGYRWETWTFGYNSYGSSLYAHNYQYQARCMASTGGAGTRVAYTDCNSGALAQAWRRDTANPFRYVGLGDSYSAGNGAGNYVDWVCYNSWNNYANRLNAALTARGKPTWSWVRGPSCSGSTTSHYWSRFDKGNGYVRPAQRGYLNHDFGGNAGAYGAAFNGAEDGLVTLTFGGNDIGFAPFLRECLDPLKPDCATAEKRTQIMNAIAALRTRVRDMYRDMGALAPNARIRVLNYPLPIERDYPQSTCLVQFSSAEYQLEVDAHRELNRVIAEEVIRVRNEIGDRLRLVDVSSRFVHHGVCGNGGYWINPITVTDIEGSFHPNYTGHGVMAGAIADSL